MAYRILIVDDDPIIQTVLSGCLEKLGYQVVVASGGREALTLLQEQSFALVLLDLYMDDLTGFDVLQETRLKLGPEALPILMISSDSDLSSMHIALQSGANDYVVKPITAEVLHRKVIRNLPPPPPPPQEWLEVGSQVGHYQIRERLHEDPGGQHYRGYDPRLRREVGLKMGPNVLDEGLVLAKIRYPGVTAVYDVGDKPRPYIVTEFFQTLPLPPSQVKDAIRWTMSTLEALESAHSVGVVHGRVSPDCVRLTRTGELKLIDFAPSSQPIHSLGLSREAFLAPEQVEPLFGPIGPVTDLFSAASLLHYSLSGSPPFSPSHPSQQLFCIAFAQPDSLESKKVELFPALAEVCARSLSKNQSDRYQSASEFRVALRPCMAEAMRLFRGR